MTDRKNLQTRLGRLGRVLCLVVLALAVAVSAAGCLNVNADVSDYKTLWRRKSKPKDNDDESSRAPAVQAGGEIRLVLERSF